MAWPVPPAGQWNPGIPLNPMATDMSMPMQSMGSYPPDQWAMMQQQNWQQWAQWQQQYAQWQNQYGEKYTQQMQAMQVMGGPPPLPPSSVPPPAPPPPEKPPPPPHENDQPLYGNKEQLPAPVPAPIQMQPVNSQASYPSVTGKNQNWSITDTQPESQLIQQPANSEALTKLAEEERLFDIQFQKWEEEIKKWKKENINHPDKKAYSEYELKFEACRGQLLERRQQMKEKRASLMGNAPQSITNMSSGTSSLIPPFPQNSNINNNNRNVLIKQRFGDKPPKSYNNSCLDSNKQYEDMPHQSYNQNIIENRNQTNIQDSYQDRGIEYTEDNSAFLSTVGTSKGIPGLDLVPTTVRTVTNKSQEIIDITDEHTETSTKQQEKLGVPDYSNITKGINNILGDEKIMNILSMMQGQKPPTLINNNQSTNNIYEGAFSKPPPQVNQWNRNNNNYNDISANRLPPVQYNRLLQNNLNVEQEKFPNPRFSDSALRMPNQNYHERSDDRQNRIPQQQYMNTDSQFGSSDVPMRSSSTQPIMAEQHRNNKSISMQQSLLVKNMPQQLISANQIQVNTEKHHLHTDLPILSPAKPKWVEEPLFAPSIIVDYEHKSLRLKAREFIEPVHMFEYNHMSKDGNSASKRNFEKEVDELFFRKIRKTEYDDERINSERFSKETNFRDYDSRVPRDDLIYRGSDRNDDHDVYHRRYEDRRMPDRERLSRREDLYSEREREYDRRDLGRDRNLIRDRDTRDGRDKDIRERDIRRDRDLGRQRELGRERDIVREREFEQDRVLDRERDRDSRRDRDIEKDRIKDTKIDERSYSKDSDNRKRGPSKDTETSVANKKAKETLSLNTLPQKPQHIVTIDDILEPPGREMRPMKIVIILRGIPGSGKSYLAKLIRDREAEHGGTARIMSIDDYFMQEGETEEKDPTTGKMVKKPSLKYEYDEKCEEAYLMSLKRAFKRSITDGYFSFLIYDAVNDTLKCYADIWNFARQNGFQVYICTMESDVQVCFKRNIHNRSLEDIQVLSARFFPTPAHHIQLDATTLLQSASIPEVHMEDADDDVIMEDSHQTEVENSFTSKWEKMDDAAQLARLDGTSKPLRPSQLSMEDYLQLDDWTPNKAKPGKKSVRWADIEEGRKQEKMRAIGFVVGQTDWNRMTDPTMGSSALTQTKYIERVRRF